MYNNPHLKDKLLPSMEQIGIYLRKSNNIDLKLRDVRPLMSALQRLPEADTYLAGLIQTYKLAINQFKWKIQLPVEFKITPEEEKRLEETIARFRRARMHSVFDDVIDGILYGISAVGLVYDNTSLGTMVVDKYTYDLTELDYNPLSGNADFLTSISTGYQREELDKEVHIITINNPHKNRKGYIGGHLRGIMLLSYLKYHTRWDWRDNNKRHGVPGTYATHPQGIDDADRAKLISMVEKLRSDAVAVFPDYVKILYDEALRSDSTDSFNKFIEAVNTEMAIALHGQNLTTEVKGGSFAAAREHSDVDYRIALKNAQKIAEIISSQYLRNDHLLNYGEPRNDFFELVALEEEQEDYESNSRIVTNLMADPERINKLPLKVDEVYKKLGFTKPAEGDETI